MANLQRCPKGHFYDANRVSCPYCEPTIPPVDPPSGNHETVNQTYVEKSDGISQISNYVKSPEWKRHIPWIAFGAAAIAAVFCFFNMQDYAAENIRIRSELSNVRQKLEKSEQDLEKYRTQENEKYGELEKTYGYGSDKYYAKIPVLVVNAGGTMKKIPIYSNLNGATIYFKRLDGNIKGEWSKKWEGHWTDLIVTPSSNTGCSTFRFTNSTDNTTFDVLVIAR